MIKVFKEKVIFNNAGECLTLVITLVIFLVTLGAFWFGYKTLLVNIEPELEILPTNIITGQNMSFVHATSSLAELSLQSYYIGEIKDVTVSARYLDVVQEEDTLEIFTCQRTSNFLPIATTASIKKGGALDFSYDFNKEYQESLFFRESMSGVKILSILWLGASFRRETDNRFFTKDFYYQVYDNQTLTKYLEVGVFLNTQKGFLPRQEIIDIIKDRDELDPNVWDCSLRERNNKYINN